MREFTRHNNFSSLNLLISEPVTGGRVRTGNGCTSGGVSNKEKWEWLWEPHGFIVPLLPNVAMDYLLEL